MQRKVDVADILRHVLGSSHQLLHGVFHLVVGVDKFAYVASGTEDAEEMVACVVHRHQFLFVIHVFRNLDVIRQIGFV